MNSACLILVCLIYAVPAILLIDGPIVHGMIGLLLCVAIAIVAGAIRRSEVEFLTSVVRPLAAFAIIPAVWMLFQMLPMPSGMAHPIWISQIAG